MLLQEKNTPCACVKKRNHVTSSSRGHYGSFPFPTQKQHCNSGSTPEFKVAAVLWSAPTLGLIWARLQKPPLISRPFYTKLGASSRQSGKARSQEKLIRKRWLDLAAQATRKALRSGQSVSLPCSDSQKLGFTLKAFLFVLIHLWI